MDERTNERITYPLYPWENWRERDSPSYRWYVQGGTGGAHKTAESDNSINYSL